MSAVLYLIYSLLKTAIITIVILGVLYYLYGSLSTWAHSNDSDTSSHSSDKSQGHKTN